MSADDLRECECCGELIPVYQKLCEQCEKERNTQNEQGQQVHNATTAPIRAQAGIKNISYNRLTD